MKYLKLVLVSVCRLHVFRALPVLLSSSPRAIPCFAAREAVWYILDIIRHSTFGGFRLWQLHLCVLVSLSLRHTRRLQTRNTASETCSNGYRWRGTLVFIPSGLATASVRSLSVDRKRRLAKLKSTAQWVV